MKNIVLILFLISALSCMRDKEYWDLKKENSSLTMDIGAKLWKNKIIKYDGDIKKADSAYKIEKKKINDELFKTEK